VGALREKNSALVRLPQDESRRESVVALPANAAATTVFLEQVTATMSVSCARKTVIWFLLKMETVEHPPSHQQCCRNTSLPRTVHSRYGCPAREKTYFGSIAENGNK
jgi:hypothetical protein